MAIASMLTKTNTFMEIESSRVDMHIINVVGIVDNFTFLISFNCNHGKRESGHQRLAKF